SPPPRSPSSHGAAPPRPCQMPDRGPRTPPLPWNPPLSTVRPMPLCFRPTLLLWLTPLPMQLSPTQKPSTRGTTLRCPARPRAAPPGGAGVGPADMVLIAGEYCPAVNQVCLEHHHEYNRDQAEQHAKHDSGEDAAASTVSERCLKYKEPSECLSKKRVPMRFCM